LKHEVNIILPTVYASSVSIAVGFVSLDVFSVQFVMYKVVAPWHCFQFWLCQQSEFQTSIWNVMSLSFYFNAVESANFKSPYFTLTRYTHLVHLVHKEKLKCMNCTIFTDFDKLIIQILNLIDQSRRSLFSQTGINFC